MMVLEIKSQISYPRITGGETKTTQPIDPDKEKYILLKSTCTPLFKNATKRTVVTKLPNKKVS